MDELLPKLADSQKLVRDAAVERLEKSIPDVDNQSFQRFEAEFTAKIAAESPDVIVKWEAKHGYLSAVKILVSAEKVCRSNLAVGSAVSSRAERNGGRL